MTGVNVVYVFKVQDSIARYLVFALPYDLRGMRGASSVAEISIGVESHDQGWSSYPQDYGMSYLCLQFAL